VTRPCTAPALSAVFEFANQGTAEGVAVSQSGDVFVGNGSSGNAAIWRAPKGDFQKAYMLAAVPGADLIGLDVDQNGNVYAAVAAELAPNVHGLWKVQPDGSAQRVGALPAFFASLPNDVTIDARGNVYVSDSFEGKIWRLTPEGQFGVWMQDELLRAFFGDFEFGINGLVYDRQTLYAAITENGRVIKIPIQPDGAAGKPTILVQDQALVGMDGIEHDAQGNLYVTNNFANTVLRIRADDLSIETIIDEGLSAPASLAFNQSRDAIYVANLSTSAGFPQPYAPSLVKATFAAPIDAFNAPGSRRSDCNGM
jgi:sugar lactone lactonase YvrE